MPQLTSDREKCAHLLRRFGLGASELELDYYSEGGIEKAVDRLLNYDSVEEGFSLEIEGFAAKDRPVNMPGVLSWWLARMLMTRRPLQERMTLFWHDHFATSASKVLAPLTMYQQNEVLRANATGKFRTLLGEVSKDPAMLFWLDNQLNVKGKPNENFAREVMELFTLGIGNYTEKDVQEAARAFTGWSIRRLNRADSLAKRQQAEFAFFRPRHDSEPKTILGRTGDFDGDDVLDILCEQPRTAEFITKKIWEYFVYPSPDPSVLSAHVAAFRDSGLDIKVLLRSIMVSKEFYSDKAVRAIVKNPVDFCVVTLRQLGAGEMLKGAVERLPEGSPLRPALAPGLVAAQSMKNMGMWLMYPPDVDGWVSGSAWITSATMVERIKWADRAFGRATANVLFAPGQTPATLVSKMLSVLDAPIKRDKVQSLIQAAEKASGGRITRQNVSSTAVAVGRLIFAAPEFQFA